MPTDPFVPTAEVIVPILRAACEAVVGLPSFAHHLTKASVERWFAFELAHALDVKLVPMGWTALVECGGLTSGADHVGHFDMLLLPTDETESVSRVSPKDPNHRWSGKAVAIELKAARLCDGEKTRMNALIGDLTNKPKLAGDAKRGCSMFLGIMVTSTGRGPDADPKGRNTLATIERGKKLDQGALALATSLECLGHFERSLEYAEWRDRVWVEIVGRKADAAAANAALIQEGAAG